MPAPPKAADRGDDSSIGDEPPLTRFGRRSESALPDPEDEETAVIGPDRVPLRSEVQPGRPWVGEEGTPVLGEALTRLWDGEEERGVDAHEYGVGPRGRLSPPGGADAFSISICICSTRTG